MAVIPPDFDPLADPFDRPELHWPDQGVAGIDEGDPLRDRLAEHWDASDHPLVHRVKAAQATRDEWWARPFRFGHADCVRMTASHLRRMGHKVQLPAAGSYASPRSALMKLKARGFESLPAALDAMGFERIAPAATIVGDVLELESDVPGLSALVVAVGNGRVLGYCRDLAPKGASIMQPEAWITAWRIEPAPAGGQA